MRAINTDQSAIRSAGVWIRAAFLFLILGPSAAAPALAQGGPAPPPAAPAQNSNTPDLWITIFSEPTGRDRLAVAYNVKLPATRLKQDLAEVATALGRPAPTVKVTEVEGIPSAEAELTGLADWRTGAINLNPLVQTFKRYGAFRVSFFFLGDFPVQPAQSFDQPPLKVRSERSGNVVNYWVSIDQSQGVPASVPLVTREAGTDWKRVVGIGALAAVVAVSVFLVVSIFIGQRRGSGRAGEGK